MTTTKSPAEAYSQQAEAISSEGKPMRWMDTARLAPLVGLGALGYAEHRAQRRDAQQFEDRLEQNYARLDAREAARAAAQARIQGQNEQNRINHNLRTRQMIQEVRDMRRAVNDAGRPANLDWRVGMVAGAASAHRHRPSMTRYNRGPRQDERFEL